MARNLKVTWKRGEVGKVISFFLEDAAGSFNLDNWTVTLAVALTKTTTPVVTGQSVVKRTQTGTNIGWCDHTLNTTTANIALGTYRACELKLVNGANVLYWPVDERDERTYFQSEVQQPIS